MNPTTTADLPTGTLTFLFTDIEGSTQLWETAPEETSRAIARHDELVEKLITANNGFLHHPARNQHALFRQATIAEEAQALRGELESRLDPETAAAAWQRGTERDLQSAVDELLGDGPALLLLN